MFTREFECTPEIRKADIEMANTLIAIGNQLLLVANMIKEGLMTYDSGCISMDEITDIIDTDSLLEKNIIYLKSFKLESDLLIKKR